MLFNSFQFLLFFPVVCFVYYLLPHKFRWFFLLLASYYFYMNWQPIYALLILFSTLLTYGCGILVEKYKGDRKRQKIYLVFSLILNFGILFIFKYYNFINESVFTLLNYLGIRWAVPNFDILLPVGISFYTFQAVGYSIDVYRGAIKAEKNLGIYALFVSFFPQLVAGPIERAKNLLGQFRAVHIFSYSNASQGLKLMLWGYFMKLCVADRLGLYVDAVFNNVPQHGGITFLLASVFFAFQIYCDFGGYSLIAIGAAKVMGFDLMENFRRPYFSKNVKEFWSRWHISLSTWFKDYVYIPLGGNRVGPDRHMLNLFITFIVSGIWHGANWTFVLWGGIHGCYQIIAILKNRYIPRFNGYKPLKDIANIFITFSLVVFGWIFFRANQVSDAFEIIKTIGTNPGHLFIDNSVLGLGVLSLIILLVKEVIDEYDLKFKWLGTRYGIIRLAVAISLIVYIMLVGVFDGGQFIYFQF